METSPLTYNLWFIDTSVVNLGVEKASILLVTKAVVATFVELSLDIGVGTDTFPFMDTSPPTNNLLFNETSPFTNRRLFIEISP